MQKELSIVRGGACIEFDGSSGEPFAGVEMDRVVEPVVIFLAEEFGQVIEHESLGHALQC